MDFYGFLNVAMFWDFFMKFGRVFAMQFGKNDFLNKVLRGLIS